MRANPLKLEVIDFIDFPLSGIRPMMLQGQPVRSFPRILGIPGVGLFHSNRAFVGPLSL
jgi:hypothetical protein